MSVSYSGKGEDIACVNIQCPKVRESSQLLVIVSGV